MNEQKLIKYLASYKEWLTKNPSAANEAKQERMEAQRKAHAFTKERLLTMSEDNLFEQQVDYEKFYLYSLITHSTAIEGSTVTEVENQLLFDEDIAAKGRSLVEQMMNVDLKEAKGEYIKALIDSREQEDSTIIQDVMLAQHITNLESRILQYQQSINDTVKSESDTVNDTATRLITLIKAHPEYTYDEYANALDIGRATVARYIKKLNGTVIKRIGSDKDGHWKFITKEQ